MKNNTLYASDITYDFEKARIEGAKDGKVENVVRDKLKEYFPSNLEYLEDTYDKETGTSATAFRDKDTGEVIIAYTGTNPDTDKFNDIVKSDIVEIALSMGAEHYKPAYKFYEKIRAEYGDNIVLTGHSLGGNIAQRVALEYNAPKTIVYNSAPLYIPIEQLAVIISNPEENLIELGLNKIGVSIKDVIAIPIGLINDGMEWLFGIESERQKIKKLEKSFTGSVIRYQSEDDILNNVSDYTKGKYLGKEYVLSDAGSHSIKDIINSQTAQEEIARINGLYQKTITAIDINTDGKDDIKLGEVDLRVKNLLSAGSSSVSNGGKIQLNSDTLRTLSNNLKTSVLNDIALIKKIATLCIEKNNKTRFDFEKRKKQVSEEIKETFKQTNIPQVLENLSSSVGKIIKHKYVLEILNKEYHLRMDQFSSNEKPYVNGGELNSTVYDTQLATLRYAAEPLVNQCYKEGTRDITSLFMERPTILKSWQAVEENAKRLLKESDKAFEGDGLRTGKEDGISQALAQVLSVLEKNAQELDKTLLNTVELTTALAENFDNQDQWIKENIKQGKFTGSNTVRDVPQNYKAYLERDGVFDDVKDVLQAFDKQVEKRSGEYAKKVAEIFQSTLGDFEKGLENWYRFVEDFDRKVEDIKGNYDLSIDVEVKYTSGDEEKTKRYYWGKLERLYPKEVKENVVVAKERISSTTGQIRQTILTSKRTKENLTYLEPSLRKIIEDGVYKGFDLDEIVNSQKVVYEIIEKLEQEIRYVRNHIQTKKMSGKAIGALNGKLEEVEKSLVYYKTFVNDCFGNQAS